MSDCVKEDTRLFDVGETIRMPHNIYPGRYRVWRVTGHYCGGVSQEGTYSLRPLDIRENDAEIHVPSIILRTHPCIERVKKE